jgi:hypothetical protein
MKDVTYSCNSIVYNNVLQRAGWALLRSFLNLQLFFTIRKWTEGRISIALVFFAYTFIFQNKKQNRENTVHMQALARNCTARHTAPSNSSAGNEVYYYPTTSTTPSSAQKFIFWQPRRLVPLRNLLWFYNWVMWTGLINITSVTSIRRKFSSILSLYNQLPNTSSTYIQKPLTEKMWAIINCIKHKKLNICKYHGGLSWVNLHETNVHLRYLQSAL